MSYEDFFCRVTGRTVYPYQRRLGEAAEFPELLQVPTGLGKTAAVIVAWLYHLLRKSGSAPLRLVYCLPMRVLVSQVADSARVWLRETAPLFEEAGVPLPQVQVLMGGDADAEWMYRPEEPALLVGTQDMLLSRALNRGYGMSRYRWPQAFGLLNSHCQWVLDETQLMGPSLPTTAQLQGLRQALGTLGPAHTMWMSATLAPAALDTIDHPEPSGGRSVLSLEPDDREAARDRLQAPKALTRAPIRLDRSNLKKQYPQDLAARALASHRSGTRTLILLNSVERAQAIHEALLEKGADPNRLVLLHSRFRAPERRVQEGRLQQEDLIVVSTQVIEAGVDLTSNLLITELAPWSSMVQRFGRCNRYGESMDARVEWLDLDLSEGKPDLAAPYEGPDLADARERLESLQDVGPAAVQGIDGGEREKIHPVLRRRDLLDLFDTSADLAGDDLDISPYIRDSSDMDLQVYWRKSAPLDEDRAPSRDELLSLPLGQAGEFLKKHTSWVWQPLDRRWEEKPRLRPGLVLRLLSSAGGYLPDRGWVGLQSSALVDELPSTNVVVPAMDGEPETGNGQWIQLADHTDHVVAEMKELAGALAPGDELEEDLLTAALWHDVGKAHPAFQTALDPDDRHVLWAKSARGTGRLFYKVDDQFRPHFRHELASALAWLQARPEHPRVDLVAWLIACHHGKVRLTLRALPGENAPSENGRLYARGVWHGDELPPIPGLLPNPLELDLTPIRLGPGSWGERMIRLRDSRELGPFRLAALESLIQAADGRASAKERKA